MRTGGRIDAIDAARGCAMVLVCFSHVRFHFDPESTLYLFLTYLTRIATPTFLLLSGFVAGHLLRSDPTPRMAVTLIDRGLFLLLVAHLLLGLSDLPRVSTVEWLFARASIPDAIGVSLCLAVLFRFASFGALVTLGASLCALSWIIGMTWDPQTEWSVVVGRLLFNVRSEASWLSDTSILPYFGTFMLGMALSFKFREKIVAEQDERTGARVLSIGAVAVGVALLGVIAWHFGKNALPATLHEPYVADLIRASLDPRFKWPPSPGYLLFYGGLGLCMAGIYFIGKPAVLIRPIIRLSSVIGRASLMCFVLQDWLMFVVPRVFGFYELQSTAFWLAYVSGVLLALYVAARQWGRMRGNRFFTIGLRALYRLRAHPSVAVPAAGNQRAVR